MSKSNLHETAFLKLVFQNIAHANIGDASGLQPSASAGSFYIGLFKTSPTDADTGIEADYTSYSRIAIIRSASGWTVSGNSVSNAALVSFPTSTGGSNVITSFGIYTAATGGDLIRWGDLNFSVTVNNTDTPTFNIGDLSATED